jgi:hypothetical protein
MHLTSLAKPIGWFSLALGAAELLKGRDIARLHGVPNGKNVVRGFGAREIAAGIGVLARPGSPVPFLARAAGDVLDIGAAGYATRKAQGDKRRVAKASLATVAGFFVLDLMMARALAKR